jgi:hypothetical protein
MLEEEGLEQIHYAKLMNHFSHFTTMEKIGKHDELILNLPDAVSQFMNLLLRDSRHFESLKRAISK